MKRRGFLIDRIALCVLASTLTLSVSFPFTARAEGLDALITEFSEDRRDAEAKDRTVYSLPALDRRAVLLTDWQKRLKALDYTKLTPAERIDWQLLRNHLTELHHDDALERTRWAEMAPSLEFLQPLQALLQDGSGGRDLQPQAAAAALAKVADGLKNVRKKIGKIEKAENKAGGKPEDEDQNDVKSEDNPIVKIQMGPVLAVRIAETLDALGGSTKRWFDFYDGFQPDFGWWVRQPNTALLKELETTAAFFRKDIAGLKDEPEDPLIGESIGREALAAALATEMIPYSAEELLALADKEFAWCEAELQKAAAAMGCKDGKEALARIKNQYAAPGGQAASARIEAEKAIRFVRDRKLVTVPALAEDCWSTSMLEPEAQKTMPYVAYGGGNMLIAYAHESMTHEDKLMAMRGNNAAFLHIVTPHELIPGHHLQNYMARRYSTQRRMFGTPFFIEGWALHWEMLLWDQGYLTTPEEKVGALFWRMHRCARVIVSLNFHLGNMTPAQMVDFLVDRVGHERAGATSEVRRYISSAPLYQAAYMIGGMQIRALRRELVTSGKMTDLEFHDRILREGPVPIEMIRAALKGESLPEDWKPGWRFAD